MNRSQSISAVHLSLAVLGCVRRHLHHLGHDVSRDCDRDPDIAAVHPRRGALPARRRRSCTRGCARAIRRPFAGVDLAHGGALRRAAVRRRQRLRDLGAAGHSVRHRRADRDVRAGARAGLRLGVLQQACADAAGAARHGDRDRRRRDDRDAYAYAVRQCAAAVSGGDARGDDRLGLRHVAAEASCAAGNRAQLHVRTDAVRRAVSACDVVRRPRVVAIRPSGRFPSRRCSRCSTWSCSAASSRSTAICGC